ncbi:MAG: signal recognition particle-docking protein FtsY [Myxococcota bacterium]
MDTIVIEILGLFGAGPFGWLAVAAAAIVSVVLARRRRARARAALPPKVSPAPAAEAPIAAAPTVVVPQQPAPVVVPEPTPESVVERAAQPVPEPMAARESERAPEPPLPRPPEPAVVSAPELAPVPQPVVAEPAAAPRIGLGERLRRTRDALAGRLSGLLGGRTVDPALLDELEELLLTADLGVATAQSLLDRVRREGQGADGAAVRGLLKQAMAEKLESVEPAGEPFALASKPHVILVLGVNGAGKTTTIGKLAAKHRALGRSVLLGAGDTFRAAAIEQLQVWGQRVGCDVIAGEAGGDPASVAFDTVKAAVARGVDVAIIDTAGRLQTKKPLMEELGKIARVIGRDVPGAPHETLLVLDANTGQNALSQARLFTEVAKVTGLVLTKLDGTAKGGVIVGLADQFGIPVRFVGVGESVDDLRVFEAREFVEALFAEGD